MDRNRDRVAALIIRDKKLLLVTGYEAKYYWSPGGKVDEGEDHEQTLRREVREELGVELADLKFYTQIEYVNPANNKLQTSHYYLATMIGEPTPSQEISGYKFFDASELPKVVYFMNDEGVESKLVSDGLIA